MRHESRVGQYGRGALTTTMALNVSEHVCTCSYAEYIDKEMLHEEAHSRHQNLSPPKGVHTLSCSRPSGRGLCHLPRGGNFWPKWGCHPGGRTGPPRTQIKTLVEIFVHHPWAPFMSKNNKKNVGRIFGRIFGAGFGGPPAAPPHHPRNPCPWRRAALGFSRQSRSLQTGAPRIQRPCERP